MLVYGVLYCGETAKTKITCLMCLLKDFHNCGRLTTVSVIISKKACFSLQDVIKVCFPIKNNCIHTRRRFEYKQTNTIQCCIDVLFNDKVVYRRQVHDSNTIIPRRKPRAALSLFYLNVLANNNNMNSDEIRNTIHIVTFLHPH